MRKNSIKISSLILIMTLSLTLLAACINGPLRAKMLDYYSNDANYVALEGVVVNKNVEGNRNDVITIQLLTTEHDFALIPNTEEQEFRLYTNKNLLETIEVEDTIQFTSAPMYFYNGHVLPIISLEKQGENLLSFEEGKMNYIEWIKREFS